MQPSIIQKDDAYYPGSLRLLLNDRAPAALTALGQVDLLKAWKLAFFCSVKCPGSLILRTYDLAQELAKTDLTMMGGFHSPVEQECLTVLMRSSSPLIVCPARDIATMRIPAQYKKPLADGRLLLVSPFTKTERRATAQMALYRNQFVAALAEQIFVTYAEPAGKTELFCRQILEWQKPLYTFDCEANRNLIAMGAKPASESYRFDERK